MQIGYCDGFATLMIHLKWALVDRNKRNISRPKSHPRAIYHHDSSETQDPLEEERRLAIIAVTRTVSEE